MKRFVLCVMMVVLACILTGCGENVNTDVDKASKEANSAKEENTSASLEEQNSVEIQNNAEIQNNPETQSDDAIQNNVVESYPTLEELNANAYDAATMGATTLIREKNYNVDIVIGDDYYATQLADMIIDFDKYEGKVVEIEGMAMKSGPYTFVGRYSENAICPTCPVGFAYYEFEWHGDEQIDLGEQKNWIKVIGKLTRGNDGGEYFYIDAYQIDVMDHWGEVSTVVN